MIIKWKNKKKSSIRSWTGVYSGPRPVLDLSFLEICSVDSELTCSQTNQLTNGQRDKDEKITVYTLFIILKCIILPNEYPVVL